MIDKPVTSTSITKIQYDEDRNILHVHFHTGKHHLYAPVPKSVFDQLSNAVSVGKYFVQHIKGKYPEIEEQQPMSSIL